MKPQPRRVSSRGPSLAQGLRVNKPTAAFWRGAGLMAAYGASHSWLASQKTKDAVKARVGEQTFNNYFRLAYNAFALPTFCAVLWNVWKHNGGVAYELRGTAKRVVAVVGWLAFGYALWCAWQIRVSRLSGFGPAFKGVTGVNETDAPEGQNPSFADGAPPRGPFAHHRHALNFIVPFIFWAFPRQTRASVGMNLVVTLYAILGSYPTDKRLSARYGRTYKNYQKRVPFLWPKWK